MTQKCVARHHHSLDAGAQPQARPRGHAGNHGHAILLQTHPHQEGARRRIALGDRGVHASHQPPPGLCIQGHLDLGVGTDPREVLLGHREVEAQVVGGDDLHDGSAGLDPLTGVGELATDGSRERSLHLVALHERALARFVRPDAGQHRLVHLDLGPQRAQRRGLDRLLLQQALGLVEQPARVGQPRDGLARGCAGAIEIDAGELRVQRGEQIARFHAVAHVHPHRIHPSAHLGGDARDLGRDHRSRDGDLLHHRHLFGPTHRHRRHPLLGMHHLGREQEKR